MTTDDLPPPFTVVGDFLSHDTTELIEQLLAMSKRRRNRLIGISFAGMVLGPNGRHYVTNAAGEMYRNPAVARGYVLELIDCLGQLSRGEQPFGWN